MITPNIEIVLGDRRWFVQWLRADGTTERKFYGNRKALIDDMNRILTEVRGDLPYPAIDEEITIKAPGRRADDIE